MTVVGARMKIEKRSIKVNNIKVSFYETGQGNPGLPLILLHGGGVDSANLSYGSILPIIGETYHVIAPDLPGYGETDKPDVPYTMEWYQDFLKDLIQVLDYKQVNLGGLSLGGGITLGYTLNHPKQVRHLILIAPYGLTDEIPFIRLSVWLLNHQRIYDFFNKLMVSNNIFLKWSLKRILVNPDAMTHEVLTEVKDASHNPDVGRAWRAFQLSEIDNRKLRTYYVDQLPDLNLPVLLLTGKNDALVPSKDLKRASTLIPHSQLVEIEQCGHWLPRDRGPEFIQALQNFL
ncbi:MAG TPA: alpha/beta hydrolase [Methanobacteriaceae archaeon]|nr:alpha/beta hydrolase [Methanobacteriaceae archaeon]